jgi:hypothetical protein
MLSGAGALTGTAIIAAAASATLEGLVYLTSIAAIGSTTTAMLSGAGTLSSAVTINGNATGTLTAYGVLTGTAAIAATASSTISGAETLAGSAAIVGSTSAVLTSPAALIGTAAIAGAARGSLTGAGALVSTAAITATALAAIGGAEALAGTSAIAGTAAGTLIGAGALASTGDISTTSTATLMGRGALSGTSTIVASASGTLSYSVSITGTAAPGTGALTLAGLAPVNYVALPAWIPPGSFDFRRILAGATFSYTRSEGPAAETTFPVVGWDKLALVFSLQLSGSAGSGFENTDVALAENWLSNRYYYDWKWNEGLPRSLDVETGALGGRVRITLISVQGGTLPPHTSKRFPHERKR